MKINLKALLLALFVSIILLMFYSAVIKKGEIRLIVRGDDMGFSHAVNEACIKAYKEGILTAVEVMVPGKNFLEAVDLLKDNPGLDVGVHLTLNSEWENIKWGPLTYAPSLVDKNGYFFPMTWPDAAYPPNRALATSNWNIYEIEQELRAQIETILYYLPNCSHATPHMGFHSISPEVNQLAFSLIQEYNVDDNIRFLPLKELSLFDDSYTLEDMVKTAVYKLENLSSGTWEFYEHPGLLTEGEENHWHIGAENDAVHRDLVTKALIDPRLREVIKRRKIKLISYRDLSFWD